MVVKKQFSLWEYQRIFQRQLSIGVRDNRRIIACAATGSGKTKTFVDTAAKANAKDKTILIISESIKIFGQIKQEIEATYIADGANFKSVVPGFVYLAMAQTLMRRQHLIYQFAALGDKLLIIYDECHVGAGAAILRQLPTALLIGFSATPEGKHLPLIYNHCVVGPQPHDLVLSGDLCGYQHVARQRADVEALVLNSAGDDYSEQSQEQVFESDEVYEGLIEDLRLFNFRKALIFCASIKDCEHTYQTLTAAGFTCSRIHTKMDKDLQKDQIKKFEQGLTPIMINVAMLTKGYDYPPIDLIVLKLKTKKLSKYIQMIGRGSRVLPQDIGKPIHERVKKKFLCIDYGQNWKMHHQWDYEHDWANIWQGKPPKRPGVPPIKYCPQCGFLCPASAKKCSNCGYEFVTIDISEPIDQPQTVLIEVTSQITKLAGKKLSELTPKELAAWAREKNKKLFAIRIAKAHAQTNEQFLREFGAEMGYKWGWARRILETLETDPIQYKDFVL